MIDYQTSSACVTTSFTRIWNWDCKDILTTDNTIQIYKCQSHIRLLRRLRTFGVCQELLVVSTVLLNADICWGGGLRERDKNKFNKLIKRQVLSLGACYPALRRSCRREWQRKLVSMINHDCHPLHEVVQVLRSSFSQRFIQPPVIRHVSGSLLHQLLLDCITRAVTGRRTALQQKLSVILIFYCAIYTQN